MISLARVSSKMGQNYYTKDSYYTKENTVEHSEWYGNGAKVLGLEGKIDAKVFQNLLDEHTKKSVGKKENAPRVALDITFSAPKSVSLASLVGGDERIIEAHNRAVNTALKIVEERFSWTRTGSKEDRQIEITGNIVAAKFMHDVSRAKDPQLHTHCVVFNQVQRADGQWRSFHNDGVFNNSKFIGLVYQNELAHETKSLGYDVLLNKNGTFDIDGYKPEQIQEFSKRTQKIKELGCKTKKQERAAKLIDRPSKGKSIPREILQERWIEEAKAVGIIHPVAKIQMDSEQKINKKSGEKTEQDLAKENIENGIKHITERDVRFKKEDMEKFILAHNMGSVSYSSKIYDSLINKMKSDGELFEYKKGFFTTKESLLVEENIVKHINLGKNKFNPVCEKIPEKINSPELNLKQGQKDALINSLQSKDQFSVWQGVAGAGKTYAMGILKDIGEQNGYTIKGFSPSKEAADVLQADSKIISNTVASLLVSSPQYPPIADSATRNNEPTQSYNQNKKELWIVDEAGLLCARDCEKLIQKAHNENTRIIFVGDTKQMSAIQAGNPFKLMQEHGVKTSYLEENIRIKKQNLKESVDLISKNKVKDGLDKIQKHIHEIKDPGEKINQIKNTYLKLTPQEQEKTLVLSSSNEERRQITTSIRSELLNKGQLQDQVSVTQLVQKNTTAQENKSILSHNVDDVLVFYKDFKKMGLEKNKQYVVKSVDIKNDKIFLSEKNKNGSNEISISPKVGGFTSYEQKQLNIAVGDKIRCTKNDSNLKIRNGQNFTVTSTKNNQVTIQSTNGRKLEFSSQKPLHLDHNYVNTVYSSQGKTSDRVIISGNKMFGKEMLYVALSRAKFGAVVFTQNKEEFMKFAQESKSKISAMDLVKDIKIKTHSENVKTPLHEHKNESRQIKRSFL